MGIVLLSCPSAVMMGSPSMIVIPVVIAWSLLNTVCVEAMKGNLAEGKRTFESSVWKGNQIYNGSKAVDGNTDGEFSHLSCFHSDHRSDEFPWWAVDLDSEYIVEKVVIWSRDHDNTLNRLNGVQVMVSDLEPSDAINYEVLGSMKLCGKWKEDPIRRMTFACYEDAVGRYVYIYLPELPREKIHPALVFCEVEVKGENDFCKNEATHFFGDHCYKFMPDKVEFDAAVETCHDLGGFLTDVSSDDETEAVREYLKELKIANGNWLIGGKLENSELPAKILWDMPGANESYSNWAHDYPLDNGHRKFGHKQFRDDDFSCLAFVKRTGEWKNRRCSFARGFICANLRAAPAE